MSTPLDRAAFHALFDAHRDGVHRFLWRLTRNAADADDLVQETFLAVWRKRDRFEGRGSAEGYLRCIAFRLWLNQREKLRRRAALAPRGAELRRARDVAPADRAVDDAEATAFLLRRVEEALEELPDGFRETFVLHRFEGLTCAEIADAMDVPVKTVETRLRRATEILAQKVRRWRYQLPGG